jgi:hypothetical protein
MRSVRASNERVEAKVGLANVAVPLLRPDQRATNAQKIRTEGLKR